MVWNALSIVFFAAGAFFLIVSSIGLLRLPDFFTRAHAVGKSETLGALLVLVGLALHGGPTLESAKLFLILIFVAITNPTGIHTLTRAAFRSGLEMWSLAPASRPSAASGAGAGPGAAGSDVDGSAAAGPGPEETGR